MPAPVLFAANSARLDETWTVLGICVVAILLLWVQAKLFRNLSIVQVKLILFGVCLFAGLCIHGASVVKSAWRKSRWGATAPAVKPVPQQSESAVKAPVVPPQSGIEPPVTKPAPQRSR
jgi:hypothetical protein